MSLILYTYTYIESKLAFIADKHVAFCNHILTDEFFKIKIFDIGTRVVKNVFCRLFFL